MSTSEFVLLLVTACNEWWNLEAVYSDSQSLSTFGISPYPVESSAPRGVFCPRIGAGWGTIHETHYHWGARACPRGATLFQGSRIPVTSVPPWAIWPVGTAAVNAEDGISGNYLGCSTHFAWFLGLTLRVNLDRLPGAVGIGALLGAGRAVLGRYEAWRGQINPGAEGTHPQSFSQIPNRFELSGFDRPDRPHRPWI